MWLERFTEFLLKKPVQAIALTFFITFLPIIGALGMVIAALITLLKGMKQGGIFILAASMPYLMSYLISGPSDMAVPVVVWMALIVAIASNLFTWIFAVMLQQKSNWSVIVQIAALVGVLIVSVLHLAYPGIIDWWGGQIQVYYEKSINLSQDLSATAMSGVMTLSTEKIRSIHIIKQYATGFVVAIILLNAFFQLAFARWWQGLLYHQKILAYEFKMIRLSRLAAILFIVSIVFYYLGNPVVTDILPIIYLLFIVAGLSFIHYAFNLMENKTSIWIWLTILYITFFISFPGGGIIICLIALIDAVFDLRKRLRIRI